MGDGGLSDLKNQEETVLRTINKASSVLPLVALIMVMIGMASTVAWSRRSTAPGAVEHPEGAPHPAAISELLVTAADFSFRAPDTVAAGLTRVRLVNEGPDMHHVQLLRIAPGHPFPELAQSAAGGHPMPPWVTPVGGPNHPPRDGMSQVILHLAAGQYAMICFIPSRPDGRRIRPDEPPPGIVSGGTTALAPGVVNFITADFAAGEYVLLCFVPDAKHGRSHFAHGMVRQIRVD